MEKLSSIRRRRALVRSRLESGQTMIFVVVGLAVVLLAIVGFAVDYGSIWFRRQHLQSAADAVCTAAAMDMLNSVSAGVATTGGVTTGTDFDCTTSGVPTSSPCRYAVFNGYDGAGLSAGTESNHVSITFPTSLTGSPIPVCPNPIPPTIKVCIPPAAMTSNPFVQVTMTSRIKATFFGLLTANNTVDVPAKAACGVVLSSAPIPLLVLDPTRTATFAMNGNPIISIYGGPDRSVQVNSTSTTALSFNGAPTQIDLHQGGPNTLGSKFGVTGIQSSVPNTASSCSNGVKICIGSEGAYNPGTRPITDPFASVTAPSIPTHVGTITSAAAGGPEGCPAPSGNCDEYSPGYYPTGIDVKNKYAIFDPGIYYVVGGFKMESNSCIRPATVIGDGSGGTFFYFADSNSIDVASNSGCNTSSQTTASNFQTASGTAPYTLGARCDNGSPASPANLPSSLSGSVLLAPCLAPTVNSLCAPNCGINGGMGYGDPFGTADPTGIVRGLLFMQNRSVQASPNWGGGGAFLLSGSMYFHQCVTSGSDTGTGCTTSAYQTLLAFGGNAAGNSYVLGDIVTDQLTLGGTPNIAMDLSPASVYFIYKASLLQ